MTGALNAMHEKTMSRRTICPQDAMPAARSSRPAMWLAIAGWCAVAALAGCGSGDRVERFSVAGSVSHEGRPVPRGAIWFEPTAAAGTIAANGFALVEEGSYRTPAGTSPGKGLYRVRIIGRDGTPPTEKDLAELMPGQKFLGQPLFPEFTTTIELTGKNDRLDFVVPSGRD